MKTSSNPYGANASTIPSAARKPKTGRAYGTNKVHWHLGAVEIHHISEEKVLDANEAEVTVNKLHIKRCNVVITSTDRYITGDGVGAMRNQALAQIMERYKITEAAMTDMVILSVSYLGHMSEATYFGKTQ